MGRLLALAPGIIGVGTVRDMDVPVTVEISDLPPDEDIKIWDQVSECTLEVSSGRLVIAGCTDYYPDAARIELLQDLIAREFTMEIWTPSAPMDWRARTTTKSFYGKRPHHSPRS